MLTLSGHKDTLLFSDWTIGQRTLSVAGQNPFLSQSFSALHSSSELLCSAEGVANVILLLLLQQTR
jgi:hypothetical protein